MTNREQPPGPTQQAEAPALREAVIWFMGQVRERRSRCQEPARAADGSMWGVYFSSSASPRSSGTHTEKPRGLCTSERPAGEESRVGFNMISLVSLSGKRLGYDRQITQSRFHACPLQDGQHHKSHNPLTRCTKDDVWKLFMWTHSSCFNDKPSLIKLRNEKHNNNHNDHPHNIFM